MGQLDTLAEKDSPKESGKSNKNNRISTNMSTQGTGSFNMQVSLIALFYARMD